MSIINRCYVLSHLESNEPIFETSLPVLGDVYLKCITKGKRHVGNFELLVKTVVDEFGDPIFNSPTIKQLISITDSYVIAANIRAMLQQSSPDLSTIKNDDFLKLKKELNKHISRMDIVKCSFVEKISEYYHCPISELSDIRFLIYMQMREKIK